MEKSVGVQGQEVEETLSTILEAANAAATDKTYLDVEELSSTFRRAAAKAWRDSQKTKYLLCKHAADLTWGVAHGIAPATSEALRGFFDILGESGLSEKEGVCQDLYGLCYLLLSLHEGRAHSGDGKIHFFSTAVEITGEGRYNALLEALLELEKKRPGDPVINSVREQVGELDIPPFERKIVQTLLKALERSA